MADAATPLKRQREEVNLEDVEDTKRHKLYNQVLSLLEAEEDEPNQDLSSLITTLQQELSSDSCFDPLPCPTSTEVADQENATTTACSSSTSSSSSSSSAELKEDEEDDKERVIRHLLEASDDELGIPNRGVDVLGYGEQELITNDGDGYGDGYSSFCDGLWQLEDEAANYYTLLQSELFM